MKRQIAGLFLCVMLAACGGGGGSAPPAADTGASTGNITSTGTTSTGTTSSGTTSTGTSSGGNTPATPAGYTVSAAQQVNTITAGDQTQPAISRFANGGWVVAWQSAADVSAQMYDASGAKVGGETRVFQNLKFGDVAALPDGSYIVSATKSMVDSTGPHQWVYVQRVSSAGQLVASGGSPAADVNGGLASTAVTLGTYDEAIFGGPIYVHADGSYSVSYSTLLNQPNGQGGLLFQNFDASGTPVGATWSTGTVLFGGDADQFPNGNVLAAWMLEGIGATVRWGVSTPAGAILPYQTLTGTPGFIYDTNPNVAVLGDNSAVIVSLHVDNSNPPEWRLRHIDASGAQVGDFTVLPLTGANGVTLTSLGAGNFLVSWQTAAGALMGRVYDSNFAPLGDAFQIAPSVTSSLTQSWPYRSYMVSGTTDNFVVVYQAAGADANEIYQVRVTR